MADQYDVGDQFRSTVEFRDINLALQDPAAVVFKLKKPDGTTQTLTYGVDGAVVKDSAGIYHTDVSLTMAGNWFHRWEGTGGLQAAGQGRVVALRSFV